MRQPAAAEMQVAGWGQRRDKGALTLACILDRDRNNFDLIRLFAALTVIFGHSFYLLPNGGYREPVTMIIDKNFSGTLAVGVFFFLSGILVTASFVRAKSPLGYAVMRIGRIYPGAIMCLLILTFVVGPMVTTLPVKDYLSSSQTYGWLRDNWSFVRWGPWPGGSVAYLPGVFSSNNYQHPNGSLWTLYPEVACYAYVFAFGLIGVLSSRLAVGLVAVTLVALHFVAPWLLPYFSDVQYSDPLKVACCFLAGAVAYVNRDRLVLRKRYLAGLTVIAVLANWTPVAEYFIYAALLYGVLVVGAASSLHRLKLPGDYSFGVYLWGCPVQQIVAQYLPDVTAYPSNLITMPAALLLAYLSWTFVEKPALGVARRLARRGPREAARERTPEPM